MSNKCGWPVDQISTLFTGTAAKVYNVSIQVALPKAEEWIWSRSIHAFYVYI